MSNTSDRIATRNKDDKWLLALLKEAQNKAGYISEKAMAEIAESLDMTLSDVYGVATFYSFLSTKPQGRNVIKICQSLPCYLRNYQTIAESIKNEIGIKPGETTPDGRFSFTLTNCIGACDQAPAMLINDDVHGNLTPGKISEILKAYK
ncbi:MAG: NADH-quinone oxidoreductase subunit NuoE [Dehalococcoidales bacterium]|nr:NADH-quinone oxidoreductase subunit NuoE [Dehalococcoidales bacterium]